MPVGTIPINLPARRKKVPGPMAGTGQGGAQRSNPPRRWPDRRGFIPAV